MRQTIMALLSIIFIMSATSFAGDCGDVNGSDLVNIQDITYLIKYLYLGGPAPKFISQLNGTVTDIDGNVYQTIAIGSTADVDYSGSTNISDVTYLISFLYQSGPLPNCLLGQVWMAENMKVTHYRNGEAIPNVTNSATWGVLTTGAYCEYNDDVNNVATYGRLYNWFAVFDSRNIAPAGWHVPTDAEWKQLEMYLGMSQAQANGQDLRGINEGGKLKESGTINWTSPNTGATNESGFSGLPGGYRNAGGIYYYADYAAFFWPSTESSSGNAWGRFLMHNHSEVGRHSDNKRHGFSVRCIKD